MKVEVIGNAVVRWKDADATIRFTAVRTFSIRRLFRKMYLTHITPCDSQGRVTCRPEDAFEREYASKAEAFVGHMAAVDGLLDEGCELHLENHLRF